MDIVTANYVASLIESNSTVIPGGFGCCGHPDLYTEALNQRYKDESLPRDLTLFFASGAGDKNGRGLDKLSANGLVKKAIGGFWGFCPALTQRAKNGDIEGHNWPMGVISHLFRDIARGASGHTTHIGLGSYIDPCIEGGGIHENTDSLVSKVDLKGEELLFYPALPIDFALLRGTKADKKGNICMSQEVAYHDALQQAMAAKNSGGKVAVQVKEIVDTLPFRDVQIPAHLVDYVTVNEKEESHPPSYGEQVTESTTLEPINPAKARIVSRALVELPTEKSCVNLGIGIPALLGKLINEKNGKNSITVESGVFNGEPKYDLSFGAVSDPEAIIGQSDLFAFYDGGGVDIAFLGFAEIDARGCVNASLMGDKVNGVGGFINIAQSAKKLVFCGTLTTGSLNAEIENDQLRIVNEGTIRKFVKQAQQITIDLTHSVYRNKDIIIVTERAVFSFKNNRLELIEIANGFSEQDIQSNIEYPIYSSSSLTTINI
ncbi:malonate decarboxylase subunit alpha [Pseudoalteromonas sp. SMS1]|uniref:malonate decarboxylase subunit alpha n=1 Tax=Pseudoalteromonas sp. SMS1 TaxID=2908894 RepID=UPI001F0212F0|nr:malonate decarboxylase subunit alpha [Pseudoalteromonas sp. SMS1]MCF2858772.1 malonate decarboxylase subunit alpha [Pseudoalteromonas sp. SMS1]